jgi:hypothetical protein
VPNQPLTLEAWAALRSTTPQDHERIIEIMKTERKAQFWRDNAHLKWFLWVFAVGIILYNIGDGKTTIRGIGALAIFLTFVGCFSALVTCTSHANALSKQITYLRTQFARAAASDSYESYLQRFNSR